MPNSPNSFFVLERYQRRLMLIIVMLGFISLGTLAITYWLSIHYLQQQFIEELNYFAQRQARSIENIASQVDASDRKRMLSHIKAGLIDTLDQGDISKTALTTEAIGYYHDGELTVEATDDRFDRKNVGKVEDLVEPMELAVSGQSGSLYMVDKAGNEILAVYRHLPRINAGYVLRVNAGSLGTGYMKTLLPAFLIVLLTKAVAIVIIWRSGKGVIERLNNKEQEMSLAFNNSTTGMALVGLDGSWLDVNETLCKMLSYDKAEMLTKTFQDITHPDDLQEDLENVKALVQGKANDYVMNKRYFRSDGIIIWVQLSVSILRDEQSDPLYFLAQIEDITQQLELEKKRQEMHADLEEVVRNRTRALTSANNALEGFAYSVSHDLRTPLRAMTGFAQALREDYGKQLDEQAEDYIYRIDRAATSMGELIDGMLRLSRSTRGGFDITEFNLADVCQAVIDELQLIEPEYTVDLSIEPSIMIHGDKRLIQNVMENLIGNAWKFTHKVPHPMINIGRKTVPDPDDESVEIEAFFVEDNGAGFEMAYAQKLFQPFQRIHSDSDFTGCGIGLATVERIIERHGGTIWAYSELNKGATFYFTIDPDLS